MLLVLLRPWAADPASVRQADDWAHWALPLTAAPAQLHVNPDAAAGHCDSVEIPCWFDACSDPDDTLDASDSEEASMSQGSMGAS